LFGRAQIARLEVEIERIEAELADSEARSRSLFEYGQRQSRQLRGFYSPLFEESSNEVSRQLESHPLPFVAGWNDDRWRSWTAGALCEEPILRIGDLVEQTPRSSDRYEGFRVPAFVPFIGQGKVVFIRTADTDALRGAALLQSLVIRTALLLPYQASYTLLDPASAGRAFPMRRYLPHVRDNSSDVRSDLDQVILDIRRINETYLDAATDSFEKIPPEIRINERFQLVFAADFPNHYDRRAIEALQNVGINGPPAGVYLFIHHSEENPLPRDMDLSGFKNSFYLDVARVVQLDGPRMTFVPDAAPHPELQRYILGEMAKAKPRDHALDWDNMVGIPDRDWWKESSQRRIETPIGARGGNESLKLWFGERAEEPCVHGMLGAMPGAGKSNLLHALIVGLAVRYSPEQLRLYLVDGKGGAEFSPYRHLPHAEVVSLNTPPELSRSVLSEVVAELGRRNEIFIRTAVADLPAYYRKGQPEGLLPRILLLVDEYQELFEGDREGVASACLKYLAEKARYAGIHMFLVSHRYGAPGMLYQTAIFGSIHLRAAMKMKPADVQALTEFGRRGKALIATCDLPGKIVVNDRGDDSSNVVGKVCLLKPERRDELIATLIKRAADLPDASLPHRVVLDGKAQPMLVENPNLLTLLHRQLWLNAEELEELARAPAHAGGFDIPDWFSAEHPRIAWIGQEFTVRGLATVIFRRRMGENAVVIGSNNAVRYGMLVAILASLCTNAKPDATQFFIADRSVEKTQWNRSLRIAYELVLNRAGFISRFTQDSSGVIDCLDELTVELERRSALSEQELAAEPSIFAIFTELDRVDIVRRKDGKYERTHSPGSTKLATLCAEGPPFGMHFILSFNGVRPMTAVLDERHGLMNFRHRIALQMSEDDSHTLVRSRRAAVVQPADEPEPVVALCVDVEQDRSTRFKPYSTNPSSTDLGDSIESQLRTIGDKLAERSR
jgi:S-DNA-T family DNA segregation ATPase FtsK/SpoIIIE